MSLSLTQRQRDLLAYLHRYMGESGGMAPTYEQMRAALDLASKSTVHRLLDGLEARGHIRRLRYKQQAIELLRDAPLVIEPGSLTDQALTALAASMALEIQRRGL